MIRLWYTLRYVLWLALEVLRQSVRLGRDVLTPGLEISPSIIEFPLRASSRLEVASIELGIGCARPNSAAIGTGSSPSAPPATAPAP